MRVLLQRVQKASVTVDNQQVGAIERGLLLLVGFGREDSSALLAPMAQKLVQMRIFSDQNSKFNLSLLDIKGGALLVPQFTLYADTSRGRRPDFFSSMAPDPARALFEQFVEVIKESGVAPVGQGQFGAHMLVALENDGPVTIMVEM